MAPQNNGGKKRKSYNTWKPIPEHSKQFQDIDPMLLEFKANLSM